MPGQIRPPRPQYMKKISKNLIKLCQEHRKKGLSHRDISRILDLSLGSIFKYTKNIRLSQKQHLYLKNRNVYQFSAKDCYLGGKNTSSKFEAKYSQNDLVGNIKEFYIKNNRIPTKREIMSHKPYVRMFGSWNKAIVEAGFKPNPIGFASRKFSKDGHKCDSFAEFIIDNWLSTNNIDHTIHEYYPNSNMSSDFTIGNIRIEFIGLAGVIKKYDELLKKKRSLIKKLNIKVVEILPSDLFPENKLNQKLGFILR